MAFTLKFLDESGFSATYIDEPDSFIVFAAAQAGNKGAIAQVMELPNFIAEATATTDTSDGEIVDLTDEGVTFPADTVRKIRCKSYCSSPNDHFAYEWEEDVLGGTTPVLLGQRILNGWADQAGTVFEYGAHLHFQATITALTTLTTVSGSKGYALGDISSGQATFLVPRNRIFVPRAAILTTPSAVSATQGSADSVTWDPTNLDGLGAGTDAVTFLDSTATTDTAAASPALGGIVSLGFECWPPINHRLVMDSNNVTIKATATNANVADDSLRHRLEIFVGKLVRLTHTS
jgi:hypothetical protein